MCCSRRSFLAPESTTFGATEKRLMSTFGGTLSLWEDAHVNNVKLAICSLLWDFGDVM